jgi:hypothetical protein
MLGEFTLIISFAGNILSASLTHGHEGFREILTFTVLPNDGRSSVPDPVLRGYQSRTLVDVVNSIERLDRFDGAKPLLNSPYLPCLLAPSIQATAAARSLRPVDNDEGDAP